MAIVSLTSIPPRFAILQKTVSSLLNQKGEAHEIRVNIPKAYRRFPEGSFSMPELPDGVKLVVLDEDYGPATKILPTISAFRGTDRSIVYCDDDRLAHPNFVQNLIEASQVRPGYIIANSGWDVDILGVTPLRDDEEPRAKRLKSLFDLPYRARRLGQDVSKMFGRKSEYRPKRSWSFRKAGCLDVMEGAGGVLLKSDYLSDQVFDVPPRVWSVDDVWLSGMAVLKGTKIYANNGYIPYEVKGAETSALCNQTIESLSQWEANLECVRFLQKTYGIWPETGSYGGQV